MYTGKCRPLRIKNYRVIFLLFMLLLTHGEVKPNPRSKRKLTNIFSCCHRNVKILGHNNLSLLTAYNELHNYDVICISKTCLDLAIQKNTILTTSRYNLIRADHPNDFKQCGVCLYFKESLKLRHVSTSFSCSVCFVRLLCWIFGLYFYYILIP